MRSLSFVALASLPLWTMANAQDDFSACAERCIAGNLDSTDCDPLDIVCICQDTVYFNLVRTCIRSDCPTDEATDARDASVDLCASVGLPPAPEVPTNETTTVHNETTTVHNEKTTVPYYAMTTPTPSHVADDTSVTTVTPSMAMFTGGATSLVQELSATVGGLAALACWLVAT